MTAHFLQPMRKQTLDCRGIPLVYGERTLVMGILNVTPDSFSDGGQYNTVDKAVAHAFEMVRQGADLIDVGGESTRPGHETIADEEEIGRVVPVIEALVATQLPVPISIDTYKVRVAERALAAGAHILNDIWGFRKQPEMAALAAQYSCPAILMHNREQALYTDFVAEVIADLQQCAAIARAAGVAQKNIILDPGFGFGKTLAHNLQLMSHLHRIAALGYPLLLGTSRKSMLYRTLGVEPMETQEALDVTIGWGMAQGCGIMRVHDVAQARRAVTMGDAMRQAAQQEVEHGHG